MFVLSASHQSRVEGNEMYVTIRRIGSHHIETLYLPFAEMSGIPVLTEYYRTRGFVIVEVKTEQVSI